MTRVKKAILEVIMHSGQHLSAEQIYSSVKQLLPTVALGTVYRNLNQLSDSRLIRRVGRTDAADFFEGNISPHDHAICIRCGQMEDIVIPSLKDFLTDQINCRIISFDLTVNYICPRCIDKKD